MGEYIARAAAVKCVLRMRRPENSVAQNRMLSIIQMDLLKLPTADVAPVVHGQWEYIPQTLAPTAGLRWTEVTTMRLIDADKLERQEFDGEEACFDYVDTGDIDNAPTVDAVPVVRCKECKWDRPDTLLDKHWCSRLLGSMEVRENDFCSYGERKDGEDAKG